MIKGLEDYTTFTYNSNDKAVLTRRGSQHVLAKGHTFAIRYANSDPSKMRIVVPEQGITKIYSIDQFNGHKLVQNSILAR